jgi:hypothetical protein
MGLSQQDRPAKVFDPGLNLSVNAVECGHVKKWRRPALYLPKAVVLAGKGPQDPGAAISGAADHNAEHLAPGLSIKAGGAQTGSIFSGSGMQVYSLFLFQKTHELPAMNAGLTFIKGVFFAAVTAKSMRNPLGRCLFLLHQCPVLD